MSRSGVIEPAGVEKELRDMSLNLPQRQQLASHLKYLHGAATQQAITPAQALVEECKTAPLFSGPVYVRAPQSTFAQYGLLAGISSRPQSDEASNGHHMNGATTHSLPIDNRLFLNVSAPWSAFICGSQGSGKSHTLSCMLENCLHKHEIGNLKNPLSGIVFHYDGFTAYGSTQLCEAAYLCSAGIPVKVLVSPTNYLTLKRAYESLPGVSAKRKPMVVPLKFQESQLNVARMKKLMAVSDKEGPLPLYIEVVMRILRDIAIEAQGAPGLNYLEFRRRLDAECFTGQQNQPLKLRLDLLESFMTIRKGTSKRQRSAVSKEMDDMSRAWQFEPGSLTIVDLSCPFVDANAACALFNITLELFLEHRHSAGRVVALDEAHKFMNGSDSATNFTESLLQVIRQQRHLATRVIIATQEPTISTNLLDLASMTIVHRFTSPAWFKTLKDHLAGVNAMRFEVNRGGMNGRVTAEEKEKTDLQKLFQSIVELNTGEGLLFSPSAMLDNVKIGPLKGAPRKLGMEHVRIQVRSRVTADGGRSMMAV
jgi:hypothetical protein